MQPDVVVKIKKICKYDCFNKQFIGGVVHLIIVIVPLQRVKK